MKKCLYLLIFLFTNVTFIKAQSKVFFNNIETAVKTGVNISTLANDSLGSKAATLPFIYADLDKKLSSSFGTFLSAGYSLKGSSIESPNSKYRFHYIDLQLAAYYNMTQNFAFETGFAPSFVYKSYFLKGIDSVVNLPKAGFSPEFDIFTGLTFKFQGDASVGFRYYFPIYNSSFNNFQICIKIPIYCNTSTPATKTDENQSINQINELKNGVLLVRLKTSENAIKYLEQQGKYEEAEQLFQQQKINNLEIINAFKQHFTFCPVYFFFNNQSQKILNSDFENVFLTENLSIDSSIKLINPVYYFAEFDILETSDEASGGTGIEALIIKDKNLKQLSKPFPFYVRKNELMMGTRNIRSVVIMLNFNLEQYYNTVKSAYKK